MARLADVVGFQHLEYVRSNTKERTRRGRRRRRRLDWLLTWMLTWMLTPMAGGTDDDDDAAVVAATAPNDVWAHDLVRRTQAATWAGCDDGPQLAPSAREPRRAGAGWARGGARRGGRMAGTGAS